MCSMQNMIQKNVLQQVMHTFSSNNQYFYYYYYFQYKYKYLRHLFHKLKYSIFILLKTPLKVYKYLIHNYIQKCEIKQDYKYIFNIIHIYMKKKPKSYLFYFFLLLMVQLQKSMDILQMYTNILKMTIYTSIIHTLTMGHLAENYLLVASDFFIVIKL